MLKIITTSWDDGHVMDFKLAALLEKYKIPGTFYIPRHNNERKVMSGAQVKELSGSFEIGGHTLNHVRLSFHSETLLNREIGGSYKWLSDLLGVNPLSFCFPGGVFNEDAVKAVFSAGYQLARTTELMSTKDLYKDKLMPTTVQLYEHPMPAFIKNGIKRRRWQNLVRLLKSNTDKNVIGLTEHYLKQIEERGGCFHLWGHSWEIEEYGLWDKLEKVLKIVSDKSDFICLQNKEILNYHLNGSVY